MRSILAELNFNPVAVIPVRDPLEVARSLERRDKFAPSKSTLLWLRHVLDAEFYSRGMPRCLLSYQDFLADWRGQTARVAATTGIRWPDSSDRANKQIDEFLSADLRRERVSADAAKDHPDDAIALARDTYDVLMRIVADGESKELLDRLDGLRAKFDATCPAFEPVSSHQPPTAVQPQSIYDDEAAIAAAASAGRHRDIIGGMWDEIGLLQFEFLRRHGLAAGDRLLDIGCGSLRGGVHFAAYLEPGHYCGVDSNKALLDAGHDIELAKLGLTVRVPRANLLHDKDFNFERFGTTFDAAIAQSLFTHLPAGRIRLCLDRLSKVVRPGGRLFATYFEVPEGHAPEQGYLHTTGGVCSFAHKDPFHYRRQEWDALVGGLPWRISWSGDWQHPRDQKMIILERLLERLREAQSEDRPADRASER